MMMKLKKNSGILAPEKSILELANTCATVPTIVIIAEDFFGTKTCRTIRYIHMVNG